MYCQMLTIMNLEKEKNGSQYLLLWLTVVASSRHVSIVAVVRWRGSSLLQTHHAHNIGITVSELSMWAASPITHAID